MTRTLRFIVVCSYVLLVLAPATAQTTLDKRQPRLMTAYKWAGLTENQRDIYVKGFLETLSFGLYSRSRPGNEHDAAIVSDWTACAERTPRSSWQTFDWSLRGETEKTVAAQFYDVASLICKDVAGKGDKTLRPVWLLKQQEWKRLSLHDRAIYLMAYTETAFAMNQRMKDSAAERDLDICIASAGIEGLISSMEQTSIEWQYPLPWSVSRAVGATCKRSKQ